MLCITKYIPVLFLPMISVEYPSIVIALFYAFYATRHPPCLYCTSLLLCLAGSLFSVFEFQSSRWSSQSNQLHQESSFAQYVLQFFTSDFLTLNRHNRQPVQIQF
ncbi:hypothetical protein MIR68_004272 [Amoeboaphelidium protococcarum]|nr:hypothetical protein MIR68_004272 [Amoeboaphelidium protococcarum]